MKCLKIAHLYPKEMNIYGDTGNRMVLEKRLYWRNIEFETVMVNIGDQVPHDTNLILGGGGQDAGQQKVEKDLFKKAPTLKSMINDGVVMLTICGLYQLLGREFVTSENIKINGVGILPLQTRAGSDRLIGNIVVDSEYGKLVGYENHSGRTWLDEGSVPLGRVIKGHGNNGEDGGEGVRFKNAFGSYMHGPLLSKNPVLADRLLELALQNLGVNDPLRPLDDQLELTAAKNAMKRP